MTEYERKKIEFELKAFTSKHLQKPSECKNPDQIRFYLNELAERIEALERTCNYAPDWGYVMLALSNAKQNSLLFAEFKNSYR
jgi:hypothetical protein